MLGMDGLGWCILSGRDRRLWNTRHVICDIS
jgi:hypothetical protein